MALGRKYQLLKDKGTITLRIKSPLKAKSQKGFLDIFYYALFSKRLRKKEVLIISVRLLSH